MAFRFHTAAAVFVLVAAGAWVLTGKYSFVGSEVVGDGKAEAAQSKVVAPVTPVAAAAPCRPAPVRKSCAPGLSANRPDWFRLDKEVVLHPGQHRTAHGDRRQTLLGDQPGRVPHVKFKLVGELLVKQLHTQFPFREVARLDNAP